MEILVHVNKRIKSRPNVQLPLNELLDMFNDTNLSSLTFFAVIFSFLFHEIVCKLSDFYVNYFFVYLSGKRILV